MSSETEAQMSAQASDTAAMPSEHDVMQALRAVYDPELAISIVDLGLVYGVQTLDDEGTVIVDMTLTTPACPLGPLIKSQAEAVLTTTFPGHQVGRPESGVDAALGSTHDGERRGEGRARHLVTARW